ncbi:hypothetical protein ACGFH8_03810 [Micromonospora sp. NPDC049175]|uniref:hypothetical protein n=1 Tax=Micromonospora sp. NPDC049175 TaxID=3364266 RepID=UPI003721B41C
MHGPLPVFAGGHRVAQLGVGVAQPQPVAALGVAAPQTVTSRRVAVRAAPMRA